MDGCETTTGAVVVIVKHKLVVQAYTPAKDVLTSIVSDRGPSKSLSPYGWKVMAATEMLYGVPGVKLVI